MISYLELERGIARWKARQSGQEPHEEAVTGEGEAVAYAEVSAESSNTATAFASASAA